VEACNHVVVNRVIKVMGRGYDAHIGFDCNDPMGESSCVQCGECTQICPVGALVSKKSIGKARFPDVKKVRTTCPYCGVGCQLDLHVKDERIVKVTGTENGSPNKGRLCVKGRYGYDFIYAEDRLTVPLIRENDGFREASWDEALDLVADKFREILETDGPDAIAGISCARSTNEDSYQMQKLFRSVLKTNNIDHCART
jgi:formate dehydrogenase major subunit